MNTWDWIRKVLALLGVAPLMASAGQPGDSPRPISRYEVLWTQSLFASPAVPLDDTSGEEPLPDLPWLRLVGWGRIGTVETAIAWDDRSGTSIVLERRPGADGNHLIRFRSSQPGVTARALIRWKGKDLWISSAPETPRLGPALTVDSRAADLDGPVLLTEGATMEELISSLRSRPPTRSYP